MALELQCSRVPFEPLTIGFSCRCSISSYSTMSTTALFACFNPDCDKVYTIHGHLLSHCGQAPACGWWLQHAKEIHAGKQREESAVITPGSIHGMTAAHFAPDEEDEDDGIDYQQVPPSGNTSDQDVPMDEPVASSSAGDSMEPLADDDGFDEERGCRARKPPCRLDR
ncbi:hypothetical protein CYLTODRAFT_216124 [Cylindrobasidium torrendii FP15055 ss-10]|uniref:Uncharacterized protein n=1 Tax=Cylindrobasidium torrendii FP15055 ss-10 TaxID=1314674 RepID=A0A0D7ATH5_9AGAR|nr:hypothetical protein CYLTODRAFT_216124 [Cylindrobasidium torrendii FP15055 ss-10]